MWAFPKYFPSIKYCTWRTLVTWQTLVTCCLSLSGGEGPLLGSLYHGGAGRHLSPKVCGELVLTTIEQGTVWPSFVSVDTPVHPRPFLSSSYTFYFVICKV